MEDFQGLRSRIPGFVRPRRLDEYAEKYRDHVALERTDDGVLTFRLHTNDGPHRNSFPAHDAYMQAIRDVGADPENHVVIFTGTGDRWSGSPEMSSYAKLNDSEPEVLYEYHFSTTLRTMEALLYSIEVPTIAAINGPVESYTFAFMADIAICSDHTVVTDHHFAAGTAPGDGLHLSLQELMGIKRAAYAAYMCEAIDAERLLALGAVNEVVPHAQLMDRAHAIAAQIVGAPWTARRATHAIVSRPWKQLLARDQGFHLYAEHYAMQLEIQARFDRMLAEGGEALDAPDDHS